MKKLQLYPASHIEGMEWPDEVQSMTIATPALDFFTDFNKNKPMVVDASASAVDTQELMKKSHVRLKFVLNEQNQFVGVVSADDLIPRLIVQKISEGFERSEITVADLMKPKKTLSVLDYDELARVTIGEVINVLKDSGQQHCLVVNKDSNKIRGIFSASDISRKLQLPVDIQEKSSFYKVFSVAG